MTVIGENTINFSMGREKKKKQKQANDILGYFMITINWEIFRLSVDSLQTRFKIYKVFYAYFFCRHELIDYHLGLRLPGLAEGAILQ